jgi:hypothetical protein
MRRKRLTSHPKPYVWTKTAAEIFSKVARALGLQMERLFEEFAVMRTELAVIQTEAVNLRADLSALTDLTLKNAREIVLVKEMLGRIDARMHRPN